MFAKNSRVALHAASVEQLMCGRCSQVYVPGSDDLFAASPAENHPHTCCTTCRIQLPSVGAAGGKEEEDYDDEEWQACFCIPVVICHRKGIQ